MKIICKVYQCILKELIGHSKLMFSQVISSINILQIFSLCNFVKSLLHCGTNVDIHMKH